MIFFRKAVLIIHGYAGGVYDEENLAFYLEKNKKLDVYQFTLPGHEKRHFNSIKCEEWISAAENKINLLLKYGYREIYLIGHSMGGVIATYLATKYHEVKKIVLAAPAFDYTVSSNNSNLDKLKNSVEALKNNSNDEILTRFLKLPLSELKEFIRLVDTYKDCYKNINIPLLMIQGKKDTLVPYKSSVKIYNYQTNPSKQLILLPNSSHDLFREITDNEYKKIEDFLIRY